MFDIVSQLVAALQLHQWYLLAGLVLWLALWAFRSLPFLAVYYAKLSDAQRASLSLATGAITAFVGALQAGKGVGEALLAALGGIIGITIPAAGVHNMLTKLPGPYNAEPADKPKPPVLPLLMLMAFIAAAPLVSCAPVVSALPDVVTYVSEALLVLEQIRDFVDSIFVVAPNPALQQKIDIALTKTHQAADIVLRLSRATDEVSKKQMAQALQDFTTAWNELMALVGPLGVHEQGTARNMAAPGELVVQRPMLGVAQ